MAALLIVVLRDWTDCWVATYFRTEVRPVSSVSVFGELKKSHNSFIQQTSSCNLLQSENQNTHRRI